MDVLHEKWTNDVQSRSRSFPKTFRRREHRPSPYAFPCEIRKILFSPTVEHEPFGARAWSIRCFYAFAMTATRPQVLRDLWRVKRPCFHAVSAGGRVDIIYLRATTVSGEGQVRFSVLYASFLLPPRSNKSGAKPTTLNRARARTARTLYVHVYDAGTRVPFWTE